MNPAQSVRLEKEKHPERFCPECLWRVTHRGRWDAGINEFPDTPCPRHMKRAMDDGATIHFRNFGETP